MAVMAGSKGNLRICVATERGGHRFIFKSEEHGRPRYLYLRKSSLMLKLPHKEFKTNFTQKTFSIMSGSLISKSRQAHFMWLKVI